MSDQTQDIRERLAEYAHEAWSGWMKYMFEKGTLLNEKWMSPEPGDRHVSLLLPTWAVERWRRQMQTPYANLSEAEKESDRAEADRMLAIVEQRLAAVVAERDQLRQRVAELEQGEAWEPNADGLLHCPFCGGQGALIEDHVLGPSEPLYSPVCEHLAYWYEHRFDPGHKGHSQCGGSAGASFANREEAIAAWNRRTTAQEATNE